MRTIETILAELDNLTATNGKNRYERAARAVEILDNADWKMWVRQFHNGHEDVARKHIMDKYFNEYNGFLTLSQMVQVYNRFPTFEEWKAHKFNVNWMLGILQKEQKKAPAAKRKVVPYKELHKEDAKRIEAVASEAASWRKRCETLEKKAHDLELENAQLRGELNALLKMVDGMRLEKIVRSEESI